MAVGTCLPPFRVTDQSQINLRGFSRIYLTFSWIHITAKAVVCRTLKKGFSREKCSNEFPRILTDRGTQSRQCWHNSDIIKKLTSFLNWWKDKKVGEGGFHEAYRNIKGALGVSDCLRHVTTTSHVLYLGAMKKASQKMCYQLWMHDAWKKLFIKNLY